MMITCLFGSSRNNGNSKVIINKLLDETNHQIINLYEANIEKVSDYRHSNGPIPNPHQDDYDQILKKILDSEVIVLSTPLYWYSMSAALKLFIDRWTESLRDDTRKDFKSIMSSKKFIVVIVGGDNPTIKAKPLINQFRYIFEFMNITDYSFLIGNGVAPSEVLNDNKMMKKVKTLNINLKKTFKSD